MKGIELVGLEKTFGDTTALEPTSIVIEPGELVVLVGPSGCGKSTLLRLIAGLETPSAGRISIGGADVTDLPPGQRNIAMVFQSYALYPHLTVAGNIGYPLRLARRPKEEIRSRVSEVASMLDIEDLLDRRPSQLSGGQRQRVAMGRAVIRQPDVFLLDEPLSNLDAQLRTSMRSELAQLQRRLGRTMVYVTHDQVEAMTLGHRIAVMHRGRVVQLGSPDDVYDRPASAFVASFIGSPSMNLLRDDSGHSPGLIGFRPEAAGQRASGHRRGLDLELSAERSERIGSRHLVYATVCSRPFTGQQVVLELDHAPSDTSFDVSISISRLHHFDERGDRRDEVPIRPATEQEAS